MCQNNNVEPAGLSHQNFGSRILWTKTFLNAKFLFPMHPLISDSCNIPIKTAIAHGCSPLYIYKRFKVSRIFVLFILHTICMGIYGRKAHTNFHANSSNTQNTKQSSAKVLHQRIKITDYPIHNQQNQHNNNHIFGRASCRCWSEGHSFWSR